MTGEPIPAPDGYLWGTNRPGRVAHLITPEPWNATALCGVACRDVSTVTAANRRVCPACSDEAR